MADPPKLSLVRTAEKNVFTPTHTKHMYTQILTLIHIHLYTMHISNTHAVAFLTNVFNLPIQRDTKYTLIGTVCVYIAHIDTCIESMFVLRKHPHLPHTGIRSHFVVENYGYRLH